MNAIVQQQYDWARIKARNAMVVGGLSVLAHVFISPWIAAPGLLLTGAMGLSWWRYRTSHGLRFQ